MTVRNTGTDFGQSDTPETDWAWCYENPKEAAALIDRLERERDTMREAVEGLREEMEEQMKPSWAKLMAMLDEAWPEDIFPTLPDREGRDEGPRIVSLLRWVDRLRQRNEVLERLLDEFDRYGAADAAYLNSPFAKEVRAALRQGGSDE
jgi:hypothetical protein